MDFKEYIEFKCISVKQPIGEFYIGSIFSKDLLQISYTDVRRIENEQRDVEKYLGIQRPLSPGRVAELKKYVTNIDATFPTSIIITVNSEDAEYNKENGIMYIRKDSNVAKIIDGQHRIAGLEDYPLNNFQLNVTIFVDMDIEDQAMVFATINLKQTKVAKSLAYDLYEFSKSRSPQKTCHNIAKLLNYRDRSPFKNKIKILGKATGKPEESITQATFVDRLIKYISRDPMKDRDLLKRGEKLQMVYGSEQEKLIFRNLFIKEKDAIIAKNLWNYFEAVEERWPKAWISVKRGNILNKTTGFGALMRFLKDVYISFNKPDDLIDFCDYKDIFNKVDINDNEFTPDNFKPGSSGEGELYRLFLKHSGLQKKS